MQHPHAALRAVHGPRVDVRVAAVLARHARCPAGPAPGRSTPVSPSESPLSRMLPRSRPSRRVAIRSVSPRFPGRPSRRRRGRSGRRSTRPSAPRRRPRPRRTPGSPAGRPHRRAARQANVSYAGSMASSDSSTNRACRVIGELAPWARSHSVASSVRMMLGDAEASVVTRGSTTSTGRSWRCRRASGAARRGAAGRPAGARPCWSWPRRSAGAGDPGRPPPPGRAAAPAARGRQALDVRGPRTLPSQELERHRQSPRSTILRRRNRIAPPLRGAGASSPRRRSGPRVGARVTVRDDRLAGGPRMGRQGRFARAARRAAGPRSWPGCSPKFSATNAVGASRSPVPRVGKDVRRRPMSRSSWPPRWSAGVSRRSRSSARYHGEHRAGIGRLALDVPGLGVRRERQPRPSRREARRRAPAARPSGRAPGRGSTTGRASSRGGRAGRGPRRSGISRLRCASSSP